MGSHFRDLQIGAAAPDGDIPRVADGAATRSVLVVGARPAASLDAVALQAPSAIAPGQAIAERRVRAASRSARGFYASTSLLARLRAASDIVVRGSAGRHRLRVWMPACKRGGMAYTIAALLSEAISRSGSPLPMIFYGTDDDEEALAIARAGRYPAGATLGMTPELRSRCSSDDGGTFRVCEELREVCVFARHSLLREAPMVRMDLVVCGRVLDGVALARRPALLESLHRSLRPGGFLLALDHVDSFPEARFERVEGGGLLRARPAPSRPSLLTPGLTRTGGPTTPVSREAPGAPVVAGTRLRSSGLDALPEALGVPLFVCDGALRPTFVSREAQAELGLHREDGDGERSAERLPCTAQLGAAARAALASGEPREVCIRLARTTFRAHISPSQQDPPRVAITCTDMTRLQQARLRAFTLQQQHSAIAAISQRALMAREPAALCAEALDALLDNLPFCTAGIVVELAGAARQLRTVASRGLGAEPLCTLGELGETGALLHVAIARGRPVSTEAARATASDDAPGSMARGFGSSGSARLQAGIACPISGAGEPLGAIALFGCQPTHDDTSEHFVSSVANLLGGALALERSRQRMAVELEVSRWLVNATALDGFCETLRCSLSAALRVDSVELWSVRGPSLEDWTRLAASGGASPEPPILEDAASLAAAGEIVSSSRGELLVPSPQRDLSLLVLRLRGRSPRSPDRELSATLQRIGHLVADFVERLRMLERARQSRLRYRQKNARVKAPDGSFAVRSLHR